MPTILVLFNLKNGVKPEEYEEWARIADVPTVKSLSSVDDFRVLKTSSMLGSDAVPPYRYYEIINVNDMQKFFADLTTDAVQRGAAQFNEFADNPLFIVSDHCA